MSTLECEIDEELTEVKTWIKNGKKDAVWHWKGTEKQERSLAISFAYFLSRYPIAKDFPITDEQKEENILRFCRLEICSLWDGQPNDNIETRCNHCAALYSYIKEKVKEK